MTTRRELLIRAASCIGTALVPPALIVSPSNASSGHQVTRRVAIAIERSGLSVDDGHRIVEIGAVELFDQMLTGRSFHAYLDPERAICPGLQDHHGLSRRFLDGKPKFPDIADHLLSFLANSELITRCESGDTAFLDSELTRITKPVVSSVCGMVRETFPMSGRCFLINLLSKFAGAFVSCTEFVCVPQFSKKLKGLVKLQKHISRSRVDSRP